MDCIVWNRIYTAIGARVGVTSSYVQSIRKNGAGKTDKSKEVRRLLAPFEADNKRLAKKVEALSH